MQSTPIGSRPSRTPDTETKAPWSRPAPRFYDVEAVRAANGTTGDGSGNSAASLS